MVSFLDKIDISYLPYAKVTISKFTRCQYAHIYLRNRELLS